MPDQTARGLPGARLRSAVPAVEAALGWWHGAAPRARSRTGSISPERAAGPTPTPRQRTSHQRTARQWPTRPECTGAAERALPVAPRAASLCPGSPAAVPIDSSAQQHTLSSTPGTEQTTPAVSSTTGTTCSIVQLHNTLCCGRRSVNCTAAPSPDRNACMVPLAPHLCCYLLAASYVWLEHSSSVVLPPQAGSDRSERPNEETWKSWTRHQTEVHCRH